jgi:hypothetical protein
MLAARLLSDVTRGLLAARSNGNRWPVRAKWPRWLPPNWSSKPSAVAEAAPTLVAGMYPFSVPTEPVRAAIAELGLPDPGERFREGLRIGLVTWLIGAAAQTEA